METTNSQAAVMTVKQWVVTLIITMIPLVGILMLFVWALGSGHNPNQSNWAKAALIVGMILVALSMLLYLSSSRSRG